MIKRSKAMRLNSVIILVLVVTSSKIQAQTNYYVSPTGNNSQSGSFDFPWQTIQYGLDHLNASDTLNLTTGEYFEKVNIPISNICLRAYNTDTPIIDALGITNQTAILSIINASNVVVDGLELRNNIQIDAQGILVSGLSNNVTIKNCVLHDIHFSPNANAAVNENTNAQGIIVYGDNTTNAIQNLKIENNELYNCRLGYSEGIAVNGNVDGFVVSNNIVYDLTNIGIVAIGHEGTCSNAANDQARNGIIKNNLVHHCVSPYATSGGLYVDGGKSIIVENNISYHNGYGIEIGCENIGKTSDNITARNNILYDNEVCGIALGGYDYPTGSGKVTNTTFRNNTCYNNDYSNSGNGEMYLSYSEGSIIENNIFYLSDQNIFAYSEMGQPDLNFNYNLFYSVGGASTMSSEWNGSSYESYSSFLAGTNTNTNSIFLNPQFISASIINPNFHLQSTSPAIGAGNPGYIPAMDEVDMDGENRLNGSIECGADEYYLLNSTSEILEPTFLIYPNPTNEEVKINFNDHDLHLLELFSPNGQLKLSINSQSQENIRLDDPTTVYILRIDQKFSLKLFRR
jgi:hypothetical protein